jgi:hypothetical protein
MKRKEGRKEGVKKTNDKARYEDGGAVLSDGGAEKIKSGRDKAPENDKPTDPPSPTPESSEDDAHTLAAPAKSGKPTATPTSPGPSPSRSPSPSPAPVAAPPARETIFHRLFPTVTDIVTHLPLTLIPFAFAMFMLVESLQHTGWIRVWGGWWAAWADVGGVPGCVWLMGMISVIGCNVSWHDSSYWPRHTADW